MKIIIVTVILIILVGAFFAYRKFVPPSFSIETVDNLSKSGNFIFSGSKNTFNSTSGGSASGYDNWVVTYGSKDGRYSFDLYHNGEFVKNLSVIW